ncbi:MAG: heterodisulfide reductase-related iron-sulfur binding cluster, partial [Pseudomonadales bacterium]
MRNTLARLLRFVVPRGYLFKPLLKLGQLVKPVLPGFLEDHIPRSSPAQYPVSSQSESRILLLSGCVQSAATPNVVASLGHLLTATGNGYQVVDEGCCGALDYHLAAHDAGMTRMRRVIDLLYPRLSGVDVILSSASGCGVTIKEYPQILQQDPVYAARAREVAEKVKDPVEYLEEVFAEKVFNANA